MSIVKDNTLMNLPSDIKLLLSTGSSSLYKLPKKYSIYGAYLLAISNNDTFFVSEEGAVGNRAGKLGEVEVEELVRIPSIQNNSAIFKATK